MVGRLAHWRGPGWWNRLLIGTFAGFYRINLNEAEKSPWSYPSLGEFFVRRLKPGARPVASAAAVHCADSRIVQSGPIVDGWCVQAKGKKYSVRDLLVDPDWKDKFQDGFFATYYLCPTDYHRVHSPVTGLIRKVTYVPGDLWPVHPGALDAIEGLYLVNERVCIEMATDLGAVAVVFVGATNVGSIELSFDPLIKGNRGMSFVERKYDVPKEIQKGQELGLFRMGSTVVVLFSKEFRQRYSGTLRLGPVVKVNSALTMN
ncbi:MAG: phosphatidylserine decarboxylase [Bdellovibrionaceae bacterium]|nr:phosphatidylserine decarboxylase [Pseudobdellovibrionaceae bacterium]